MAILRGYTPRTSLRQSDMLLLHYRTIKSGGFTNGDSGLMNFPMPVTLRLYSPKWSKWRDSHPRYFRPKRNAIAARRHFDKMGAGTAFESVASRYERDELPILYPAIKWWGFKVMLLELLVFRMVEAGRVARPLPGFQSGVATLYT